MDASIKTMGFRDAVESIAVADVKPFIRGGFENALGNDFGKVVTLTDYGAADTAGHGPDLSFVILHIIALLPSNIII